jgi:hypothetical protein
MLSTDEFIESCTQILNANFGSRSKRIIDKVKSKKKLKDTSNMEDFEEFINLIECNIGIFSRKNNAVNICNTMRSKAIELDISKQATDIHNALLTETTELSITEFLRKINITDACAFRTAEQQKHIEFSIDKKIEEFLSKHTLPTEGDINRYATFLAYKYYEDVKNIKKNITEKARNRVKTALGRKVIREEIKNLVIKYPQLTQTDIDDFIKYVHLLKLNFQEDELRQQIEDELHYRKFYESQSQDTEGTPEFARFLDIIKTCDDKKDIGKEMQRQGIIYLIEDESGVSDKLLDEFIVWGRSISI